MNAPATGAQPSQQGTRPPRRWRGWQPLRLLSLFLGLALLVLLLRQVGLGTLVAHARQLGWTFLATVALFGGVHLLRTISWRLCLQEDRRQLPFRRALSLWLAGEAVAHLSFGWSGDAFRAAASSQTIPVERGLSALLASRIVYFYSTIVLMTASFMLGFFLLPPHAVIRPLLAAASVPLLAISVLPLTGRPTVTRLLNRFSSFLARHSHSAFLRRLQIFVTALEHDLAAAFLHSKRNFARLAGLNFLATFAGVLEVYLILRGLRVEVSLATAFLLEGIGKTLGLFAFVVPGNVGVREGGMALIFQFFEMSAALALTLVLARRARALVWVGIGNLVMILQGVSPAALPERPTAGPGTEK